MDVLTRRTVFGASAGLALAVANAAAFSPTACVNRTGTTSTDAELIRICHRFAEGEFRSWWRYVTAPADLADKQDVEPDYATLQLIEAMPATTSAGWAAKALAYSAWNHSAYDDDGDWQVPDGSTGLLAGLLRDMVAPARAEILAHCAAEYGPLGEGYTPDARWIGHAPAGAAADQAEVAA